MPSFADIVSAVIGLLISTGDAVTMAILTGLLDACIVALWCQAVYLGWVSLVEQGQAIGRGFGLMWSSIGFASVFLLAYSLRGVRGKPKWFRVQCAQVLVAAATALTWSGYTRAKWDALCRAARRIFCRAPAPILPTTTTMVCVTTASPSDPEAATIHDAIAKAVAVIFRRANVVATPSPNISSDLFSTRTTHFVISKSLTEDVSDYCLSPLYAIPH